MELLFLRGVGYIGAGGIEGDKEPVARRQGGLVNEILRRRDGTPGEGRDPTRGRVDKAVQIRARCQTWAAETPEPPLRSASSR
jgi:hypothetical protein